MSWLKALGLVRRTAHPWWVGDEDDAALIDLNTGRVIGRYIHDGYGKWEIDVCLTYWRAWQVFRSQPAFFQIFAAFPRCWISLFRAKSKEAAIVEIEQFVGTVRFEMDVPDE